MSLNIYLASPYLTILHIGLSEDTGYRNAELWILDLANFASVKSFADRFDKDGGRLDILVENAAVLPSNTLELTSDGWEITSVRVCERNSFS